jgi:hypothetical protein
MLSQLLVWSCKIVPVSMGGDREHPFQGAKSALLGRLRGQVRVMSEL